MEKKIGIMVVDDSGVFRGFWSRLLSSTDEFVVVTTAVNGKTAIDALAYYPAVDLVLLDVEMPEMNGIDAIPKLLEIRPNLKIIMASSLTISSSQVTLSALANGAHDFVTKPTSLMANHQDVEQLKLELVGKIKALAKGKGKVAIPQVVADNLTAPRKQRNGKPKVILIGSSTGGPNALGGLIQKINPQIQQPILIVQHMPPTFTTMLAEMLSKGSNRICREAQDGEVVQSNRIYLAPGGYHMVVRKTGEEIVLRLNQDSAENFCRPSVDVLFRSAAEAYREAAVAIILTGMGEDGKIGSGILSGKGCTIIAQDEATSVVWGMPGAIVAAGLADFILPLDKVGDKIRELCL